MSLLQPLSLVWHLQNVRTTSPYWLATLKVLITISLLFRLGIKKKDEPELFIRTLFHVLPALVFVVQGVRC